jgi:hypothetical protein
VSTGEKNMARRRRDITGPMFRRLGSKGVRFMDGLRRWCAPRAFDDDISMLALETPDP